MADPDLTAELDAAEDIAMGRISPFEQLADEIDAHCRSHGREWHAELTAGSDCFWACKLTVVLTPYRDDGPDRSLVAYAAAGDGPEDVFRSAWDDMRAWLDAYGGGGCDTTEETDG